MGFDRYTWVYTFFESLLHIYVLGHEERVVITQAHYWRIRRSPHISIASSFGPLPTRFKSGSYERAEVLHLKSA